MIINPFANESSDYARWLEEGRLHRAAARARVRRLAKTKRIARSIRRKQLEKQNKKRTR